MINRTENAWRLMVTPNFRKTPIFFQKTSQLGRGCPTTITSTSSIAKYSATRIEQSLIFFSYVMKATVCFTTYLTAVDPVVCLPVASTLTFIQPSRTGVWLVVSRCFFIGFVEVSVLHSWLNKLDTEL